MKNLISDFCNIYFFEKWLMVDYVLKNLRKLGLRRFLRTLFRNANELYSITRWLGGFNPKVSGVWAWSFCWEARFPTNQEDLGEQSLPNIIFSPNSLGIWNTKSTISQKLKILKTVKNGHKSVPDHCASSETKKDQFSHYSKNFERP